MEWYCTARGTKHDLGEEARPHRRDALGGCSLRDHVRVSHVRLDALRRQRGASRRKIERRLSFSLGRRVRAQNRKSAADEPQSSGRPRRCLGKKFASTAADWSDEAFACDGFRVRDPQRFQYEWVKTSDTEGTATARADFNGDGVVEATFEQELKCENKNGKLRCGPGAFKDRNH